MLFGVEEMSGKKFAIVSQNPGINPSLGTKWKKNEKNTVENNFKIKKGNPQSSLAPVRTAIMLLTTWVTCGKSV